MMDRPKMYNEAAVNVNCMA